MAENAGNTEDSALTVKMMASSPASEKKHRSNGSAAPAHQAANHSSSVAGKQTESLTPPAVTEKKPQTNGQASPVRPPAISNNSQAGKQCLEGFLKTDDRMRLAKERREERERSLAAREQAIREKERRAQLQYERTVEERWKRLEEQRLKEEQRRAAVEEKRRQQLEEEKERLEALMRRSLERSLQLENRSKRWIWGGNGSGHGDWENAPPLSAASVSPYDLAAPSPAASESGNVTSSPHRSPYRGSPSRRRGNAAFTEEFGRGSNTAPSTPKRGSLRRERGMISPATGSPVRRPDDVIHRSTSPATPKLTPKRRNQSPVTVRQYPVSPLRHRPATPNADSNKGPDDKVTNDKQATKVRGQNPGDKKHLQDEEALKKSPDTATPGIAGKMESPVQKASSPGTPEKGSNSTAAAAPGQRGPAMGNQEEQSLKAGSTQKHNTNSLTTNKSTDQSPATPAEKAVTRMTDAEEVSRLLVERRHLAHVQKQQEEQERIKAELRKRQVDMQAREEQETRREEDELRARKREEEELEREREVVERQRQDRELMKQQEEEERQQRKKRIEEIMKRTRKNEGELKREDSQEPQSPSPLSPPGEIQVDSKPANEVKAPPSGAPVGSAPGSQAPLIGAQVRSNPSSQAPPTVAQARPTPGSQAPPTGAQAGSATDSWAKPPGTPSRQGSAEKRVERFVGSESMHAPAQVLPRSPSPNGQARSAKALDQKGNREHEKPQSNSTPRDEVRRDESSPAKGRPSQPKASAETSVQKPENIQPPARNRERAVAQEKARALVLVPRPQLHANSISPAVTQEQKGEAQVKNLASEKATILHESWALLQKSAAKMSDSPQVNGQGHQMKSQICTAQVKAQATPQPNGQAPLPVMSKGVVKERSPASHPPLAVSRTPPPLITLEPLEGRQGAREKKSADEVQSMEISPVSKEELISIPQFSPVADVRPNSMSKTRALEDLLDLTGQVAYPKLPPSTALGDCNKNLIEGMCSPGSETKVIANNPPASSKLNIQ